MAMGTATSRRRKKDKADAKGTASVKGNAEGATPVQKVDEVKDAKRKLIHEELADEE